MKYIISGTDREGSTTLVISKIIQRIYSQLGESVEIIDLKNIKHLLFQGPLYGQVLPKELDEVMNKILHCDGLIVVVPEYNGSMPGILKYFIDHMKFPETFEYRPVCFVGLGGMFGGLRPVEHLQGVFGYRNAFVFPKRVFLMNVWKQVKDGELTDANSQKLLELQAQDFQKFTKALASEKIHARNINEARVQK